MHLARGRDQRVELADPGEQLHDRIDAGDVRLHVAARLADAHDVVALAELGGDRLAERSGGADHYDLHVGTSRRSERRDAQHLPGIDLVGVVEHRLVGLEDRHVLVGVAVVGLGDFREVVAAHHGVEHRLGLAGIDRHAVVHLHHARDVAAAQHDLLARGLVGRRAEYAHGSRRAIEGDCERFGVEILRMDVGDDRVSRLAVQFLDPRLRRRVAGFGLGRGGLDFLVAEELLAGFLDERDQAHVASNGGNACAHRPAPSYRSAGREKGEKGERGQRYISGQDRAAILRFRKCTLTPFPRAILRFRKCTLTPLPRGDPALPEMYPGPFSRCPLPRPRFSPLDRPLLSCHHLVTY